MIINLARSVAAGDSAFLEAAGSVADLAGLTSAEAPQLSYLAPNLITA